MKVSSTAILLFGAAAPSVVVGQCDVCADGGPITQPDAVVPGCGLIQDATCTETLQNSLLIPSNVCDQVQIFTDPICCQDTPFENPVSLCPESEQPSMAPSGGMMDMDGDMMMDNETMAPSTSPTFEDSSAPSRVLSLSALFLAAVAVFN